MPKGFHHLSRWKYFGREGLFIASLGNRSAAILVALLLLVLTNGGCTASSEANTDTDPNPGRSENLERQADSVIDSSAVDSALAESFQTNVSSKDVPKPGGELRHIFDIECRVFHYVSQADGRVFSDCGNEHSIIAANLNTGEELWRFQPDEFVNHPIPMDGLLYVGGERNVFAVDPATGRELWRFTYRSNGEDSSSPSRVPVVEAGVAYVISDDDYKLHALDAKTGQPIWEFGYAQPPDIAKLETATSEEGINITRASYGNPVVAGDTIFLITDHYEGSNHRSYERLHSIDLNEKQEKWAIDKDKVILSDPVIADGIIYLVDGASTFASHTDVRPQKRPASHAYAIDMETGQEKWSYDIEESLTEIMVSSGVALLSSEYDLSGSGGGIYKQGGHVFGLDAASGQQIWSFETDGGIKSEMFVAGTQVIFQSERNQKEGTTSHIYVRDVKTGEHRWMLFNEQPIEYGWPTVSIVDNGVIYLLGSGDKKSGIWQIR